MDSGVVPASKGRRTLLIAAAAFAILGGGAATAYATGAADKFLAGRSTHSSTPAGSSSDLLEIISKRNSPGPGDQDPVHPISAATDVRHNGTSVCHLEMPLPRPGGMEG